MQAPTVWCSTSRHTWLLVADQRRSCGGSASNSRSTAPIRTTTCLSSYHRMPVRRTAAPELPAALAIRGATVVTMDPLRTVTVADVVVDTEGRIVALAEPGSNAPAEHSIDGAGLTVVP